MGTKQSFCCRGITCGSSGGENDDFPPDPDNTYTSFLCKGLPCRASDVVGSENTFTDEFGVEHHVSLHENHADGYGSASDTEASAMGGDCEDERMIVMMNYSRPRDNAVFCTKFGEWNRRVAGKFQIPKVKKTKHQLIILEEVIQKDVLFRSAVELQHEEMVANAVALKKVAPGEVIVSPGAQNEANALHIVLEGSVSTSASSRGPARGGRPAKEMHPGQYFGDEAILWHSTWNFTAKAGNKGCTLGVLTRSVFQMAVVLSYMEEVERRVSCLHKCPFCDTFNDEQIMKLVEVLDVRTFKKGDLICREGQIGHHFFIIESGEVKEINGSKVTQVHREGHMVGQETLFKAAPRRHTLKCQTNVEVLVLSRRKFERLKGPLKDILEEHALADPRRIISDFFKAGTPLGPKGAVEVVSRQSGRSIDEISAKSSVTRWFVVFRPTSRDAITKLISGQGVGKGLNVKGKSAKKGILSAFVPFLQISDNDHKSAIEASPPDSYIKVFYRNKHAQEEAFQCLRNIHEAQHEHLHYDRPYGKDTFEDLVTFIDSCESASAFGLLMPEVLLHEAYIELEDLRPHTGWETGRKSEPAYMDMNLHSIREHQVLPECVLWQFDEGNPMNGHGLLIAYQEGTQVKPVVSDFDMFLVGSMGMTYKALPSSQVDLARWSLDCTEGILRSPGPEGWTARWLAILHDLAEKGDHHDLPTYGYGDDSAVNLVKTQIDFLKESGSIRHGAECFNYHFPQELDNEYLIIWDGLNLENWRYVNEEELRAFLIERAEDGYCFPINPVWPVRDKGWYEVLVALRAHPDSKSLLANWFPPDSGMLARIDRLRTEFPECFQPSDSSAAAAAGISCATAQEHAELGLHTVKKKVQGEQRREKKTRSRGDVEAGVCEHSGVVVNYRLQHLTRNGSGR